MANILSTLSDQIEDLRAELVLSLELQRGEGCDLDVVAHQAERFADTVRPLLAAPLEFQPGLEAAFPAVDRAYGAWKAVRAAFLETLDMAYCGAVPRGNLLLDEVVADLTERAGDPLAALYTDLRNRWRAHLRARPWDAFHSETPTHADAATLERSLGALAHGDELDVEDALDELTGDLRHAFADFVETHPADVGEFELNLWKRPEILVAGDYWGRRRSTRLIPVLEAQASERFAWAMRTLQDLFNLSSPGAASVADRLRKVPETQRARFCRCLMLHPDYEVRRYAASNVDLNSLWKTITSRRVPCATILTLLEAIVGSSRYTVSQKKIFFDTIYRRLLQLSTRSDVLYARGIVRILTRLDFFIEDGYFRKLMVLLDYLEAKERVHGIVDGLIPDYIEHLERQKDRVGAVAGEPPGFEGIPVVVLRKLARDGHFWALLATHPIVKIARETVPHIATAERALQVAGDHRTNQEVLRAIGKRRHLFRTARARNALLGNPRTPLHVSLDYVTDLTPRDVEQLLRRSTLHPEFRSTLRNRYTLASR